MKNLKLKAARAAKDLSQDELAKLCNVSRQTISAIEKGDYNPTINLCIIILILIMPETNSIPPPDNTLSS